MSSNFEVTQEQLKTYFRMCRELAKIAVQDSHTYDRDIADVLHETVDGHEWIIYTAKARLVLCCSDHPDALSEELGETEAAAASVEQCAFWAMLADVQDYLSDAEEGTI